MDAYDDRLVPDAYGLNNTGAICYFNAFLQALASCTAFSRAVLENEAYLRRTGTGAAVREYITAATARPPAAGVGQLSAKVLGALVGDLAARRPHVRFGAGQESSSEALDHLLDMMEPPGEGLDRGDRDAVAAKSAEGPITRLFLHRFRCEVYCKSCRGVISRTSDYAVRLSLFHFDGLRAPPATPEGFSAAVRLALSESSDFRCPTCEKKTPSVRAYRLTMAPEIIVGHLNIYRLRPSHYFPERFALPGSGGGELVYRLVAQVEHAGGLEGGHYWARARRAGGVAQLNDSGVSPAAFSPSPGTYLIFYHYAGAGPA